MTEQEIHTGAVRQRMMTNERDSRNEAIVVQRATGGQRSERGPSSQDEPAKRLRRIERKLRQKQPLAPPSDDPVAELKRIVRTHRALTKAKVALINMSSDRVNQETGEKIPCMLPMEDRDDMKAAAERRGKSASRLEGVSCPDGKPGMLHELRKFDVYNLFLRDVYGLGPVTAAYLLAYVDIRKAEKPSQLIRYCGYACIDGKAERRRDGFAPKTGPTGKDDARGTYNAAVKSKIYIGMGAMWKNGVAGSKRSKYLDRWRNEKERRLLRGETKGKAHDAGRRAATDLFLYDLYLVWRSVEGLPSWVTWYDWTRGYEHGQGPLPRENAPRILTVEEALAIVGDVGAQPLAVAAVTEMRNV